MNVKNMNAATVCGALAAATLALTAAAQTVTGRTPGVVQEREQWWRGYTAQPAEDLRVLGQPESAGPDLYDWAYDYMYDDYYDFDEFPERPQDPAPLAGLRRDPDSQRIDVDENRVYGTDGWTPRGADVREYGEVPRYNDPQAVRTTRGRSYDTTGEYGLWSEYDEGSTTIYRYQTTDRDFEAWYDAD